MGKIRLKFAFALVFCVLSCFFVFAEDGGAGNNSSPPTPAEPDKAGIAEEQQQQQQQQQQPGGNSSDNNGNALTAKNNPSPKPVEQPAKYTVTFDAEGGSKVSAQNIENGSAPELSNEPAKKGYQFGGWYTERDGKGTDFNVGTRVHEDITVYAKWIPEYTVTFDAGNGSTIAPKQIKSGDSLEELLPSSLEKTGYRFDGWFTTESGGGTQFYSNTPVRDNITIYARWTSWESIRISKLEEEIEKLKTGIKNSEYTLFLSLVVTGIFTLLLTALSIILLLSVKSAKKEIRRLDAKSEDKYGQIYRDFTQKLADITEKPPHGPSISGSSPPDFSAKDVSDIKNELGDVQNRIQEIEIDTRNLKEDVCGLKDRKTTTDGIASGNLSVEDVFNRWAANPSNPLSFETFYYIKGEMNIRSPCEIRESAVETKWITNRQGAKKYLFPNPNLFDQMTDIHNLSLVSKIE
jgi:uncharacterized repeat protein (TIGR02543 family)